MGNLNSRFPRARHRGEGEAGTVTSEFDNVTGGSSPHDNVDVGSSPNGQLQSTATPRSTVDSCNAAELPVPSVCYTPFCTVYPDTYCADSI